MESLDDKNSVKDRILDDLGKSIKLVQRYALCGYEGVVIIGNDSWLVQSLCHLLDLVLLHGLRDLHRGYWSIVREFSHSDTLQIIQSLKTVSTSLGKGRSWLYYTLTEGSLQSYLHCLCRDIKILHKNYVAQAILRDTSRTQQLLTLLAGLEQVQFNLDPDVAYLDMAAYQQQHSEVSSDLLPSCGDPSNLGSRMTSSVTSSLASPVDSGVALLDSDADTMSVSEATINETDNLSLRDDKEDDSTFNEIEDNRINHQLLSWETTMSQKHKDIGIPVEETECCNTDSNKKSVIVDPDVPILTEQREICIKNDHSISHPSSSNSHITKVLPNKVESGCDYSKKIERSVLDFAKTEKMFVAGGEGKEPVEGGGCGKIKDPSLSVSPENEITGVTDMFRNRSFSVMTASDIANQNISEGSVSSTGITSHVLATTTFVESKNKVNSELNVLEDDKSQQSLSVRSDCDTTMKQKCDKDVADSDDIVYRRQRSKKKRNNGSSSSVSVENTTKVKRVSFHEDFVTNENENNGKCQSRTNCTDFSVSFLPPDSVIKRDAVKGRYSWCGEGDAPFVQRRRNESDTKSDFYLSSSSDETLCMEDPLTRLDHSSVKSNHNHASNMAKQSLPSIQTPPVAERGTPEGQEDPPITLTNMCVHNNAPYSQDRILREIGHKKIGSLKKLTTSRSSFDWSDSESIPASDTEFVCSRTGHLISSSVKTNSLLEYFSNSSSLLDIRTAKVRNRSLQKSAPLSLPREVPSKTPLLKRFMRSLTEKKVLQKKPKVILKPSRTLFIPGIKILDHAELLQHFTMELNTEMILHDKVDHDSLVVPDLEETFKTHVFLNAKEKLYKVFKVSTFYSNDGVCKPLLALLTDVNLYLTGIKSNCTYYNHLVIPYNQLDAMLVGPNSQCVLLVCTDREVQSLIVTGSRAITEHLVSHIEIAMRRAPTNPALPAVKMLGLEDMKTLAREIIKNVSFLENEAICHYSLVHLQDVQVTPPSTPMGPTKEGHLMYRLATEGPLRPWKPGFIMLKAGVIYMFNEKSQRLPKRVVPLRWNGCQGCRRIPYAQRPYTFEVILGPRRSLQFAAADEYEASDWLQVFIQAASGVYEEEKIGAIPCSLIVTEQHLVTCQEKLPTSANSKSGQTQILSCAAVQDVVAFTVDSLGHNWCVLEFACREVHENSGDWILYFATADELSNFKDIVEQQWRSLKQTDFPLRPVVDDSLSRRCTETSTLLAGAWDILLPVTNHDPL